MMVFYEQVNVSDKTGFSCKAEEGKEVTVKVGHFGQKMLAKNEATRNREFSFDTRYHIYSLVSKITDENGNGTSPSWSLTKEKR